MIVSGSTAFGTFDNDASFQADAPRVISYVMRKLGDPTMTVEIPSASIIQSFEEACLEFSAVINTYQAKSVIATLLGTPTGTLGGQQNRYPQKSLEFQQRMGQPYGELAGVGGVNTLHSGSVGLTVGVQSYDLQALINPTGSDGLPRRMAIKDIYHYSPLSAWRFFGTTSAVNYLHNQFNFESFTPETVFYLLPVWEDIMRGMQFETSNRVRRSNYSYDLHNNVLTVYPVPTEAKNLHFTYYLERDPYNPDFTDRTIDGVSNLSNVPFGHIMYSNLNSISKQWTWKMSFALSKEILGHIRGKFATIPIPNGDVQLDGQSLISEAKEEQGQLRQELRSMLEDMTYDKLAAREAEMADAINKAQTYVPLKIYVG